MSVDPRFGNSSGYFKDPITGDDLTIDMPRAVPCSFENGKFQWPMVLRSDGEEFLKIVYRLFTDEEKALYKAYRGRPDTGESKPRKPRSPSGSKQEQETVEQHLEDTDQEITVTKYNPTDVATPETLLLIAECDTMYGISNIGGLMYAMIGKLGEGTIYHIPRSLIPDDDFDRICDNTKRSYE